MPSIIFEMWNIFPNNGIKPKKYCKLKSLLHRTMNAKIKMEKLNLVISLSC